MKSKIHDYPYLNKHNRSKKVSILLPVLFCLFHLPGWSQGTFQTKVPKENTTTSVRHLLESLIGQGIVLKNYSVTRSSAEDAFGFFEDERAPLGMKKGFLMTSGGISKLTAANRGPGFSCTNSHNPSAKGNAKGTYPELSKLLKNEPLTYDACVIELDIVPTSDTLSFNYVFGSEEYDEYVGSQFNDVFGFFISGKGIEGDKNLAVVPGTDVPVSINTINGGSAQLEGSARITGESSEGVTASNPSFYVRNTDGHIAIEYDGLTRLMEIRQPVIAYETYHLKIAIADVSDDALDSGVFIEGQSFISYEKSYNALFDQNSSDLDQGYKTMLTNFVTACKNKPGDDKGKIMITGHTDSDGAQDYNDMLSKQRASEVYQYLKEQGMSSEDMVMISKGENMPRGDNFKDEGKQMNRRVEVKMCGSLAKYQEAKRLELQSASTEPNALKDNYPNPFDNNTTIRSFIKPEIKNASLVIQDVKGNLVKTIFILERGNSETYFGAEDLGGGIYVATLFADQSKVGSIKMVIQK